jgi:hypothetical protein
MRSKARHEGYLLIDHRASPGIDHATARMFGAPCVGEGQMLEAPTFTCSHCNGVVIVNPDRRRERAYCRRCDHLVCDGCGAVGECRSFARAMDLAQENVICSQPIGGVIDV